MTGRRGRRAAASLALAGLAVLAACSSSPTTPETGTSGADRVTAGSVGTPAGSTPRAPDARGAAVAQPTVTGPLTGGQRGAPFNAMPADLRERAGYVEEEYLVSGTATAYREAGPWGTDGAWSVEPTTGAPYTTRILVRRPSDPAAADGTVLVEWLNVTSGLDSDVEFAQAHDELLSHGTTWVGVSAQAMGVQGGGAVIPFPGLEPTPLKVWDPTRYGSLVHPGDDHSYDIFSQVAAALRRPGDVDPLGGVPVTRLLAAGESQSAARMVTYVNAVHPVARIYDGFLVHSRSTGGSVLHTDPAPQPPFARIRGDLEVPVLQLETEGDILGLPFLAARQPDTDRLRTWEVAGTSHLDRALFEYFAAGAPAGSPSPLEPLTAACGEINDGPQAAVVATAVEALRTWVVDGVAPAAGAPLRVEGDRIVRDEHGNALGGIRTPPVDAPVAALRGDNAAGGYVCGLLGSTVPFDAATLAALYPDHETYVRRVTASAEAAVAAGHLRRVDADRFVADAERSTIGR
ncbi:MAG: alpha/beta hydrolase domain-containing protein [Acidimicrobiales bacterium]